MPLVFDPSTDFEDITDGLEAVTLDRRGSSSNVSVTNALQRAVSTREVLASDGKYRTGDVRWHLPVAECASAPSLGDALVDAASARWIVLAVVEATLSNRWACVCRNVAIAYGLDDTVDILAATYSKGTGGAAEASYKVWKTGIRARIQPESTTPETVGGARKTSRRYQILLGEEFALTHQHQVRDVQGAVYQVESMTGAERIGELSTITARKL